MFSPFTRLVADLRIYAGSSDIDKCICPGNTWLDNVNKLCVACGNSTAPAGACVACKSLEAVREDLRFLVGQCAVAAVV
jgi:hypothetical protein